MSRVEARLDEAEAATRRIGRKDWLLLFCGVMFTVMVTISCPRKLCSTSSRWHSTAWTTSWAAGQDRRISRPLPSKEEDGNEGGKAQVRKPFC